MKVGLNRSQQRVAGSALTRPSAERQPGAHRRTRSRAMNLRQKTLASNSQSINSCNNVKYCSNCRTSAHQCPASSWWWRANASSATHVLSGDAANATSAGRRTIAPALHSHVFPGVDMPTSNPPPSHSRRYECQPMSRPPSGRAARRPSASQRPPQSTSPTRVPMEPSRRGVGENEELYIRPPEPPSGVSRYEKFRVSETTDNALEKGQGAEVAQLRPRGSALARAPAGYCWRANLTMRQTLMSLAWAVLGWPPRWPSREGKHNSDGRVLSVF